MEQKQKEWYENKALFEMMMQNQKETNEKMEDLKNALHKTDVTLQKTQMMMEKYNGLHEKQIAFENRISKIEGNNKGSYDTLALAISIFALGIAYFMGR